MGAGKIKIKSALTPALSLYVPEGEGADRVDWEKYADVKYRIALGF